MAATVPRCACRVITGFPFVVLFQYVGRGRLGQPADDVVFWELGDLFLFSDRVLHRAAPPPATRPLCQSRRGFGMLVGLMAIWACLGTFAFGDSGRPGGHLPPGPGAERSWGAGALRWFRKEWSGRPHGHGSPHCPAVSARHAPGGDRGRIRSRRRRGVARNRPAREPLCSGLLTIAGLGISVAAWAKGVVPSPGA
jgi:hypothetical protein